MKTGITAALVSACVAAQGTLQTPVFRTHADRVRVDVLVSVGERPVGGLSADDFQLLDNHVPQRVQLLDRGGPVWLVLVLDVSESVQGEKLQRLRQGCETVIRQLKPGDEAALLTFSEEVTVAAPLSPDLDVPSTMLREVRAGGRTALYDAVFAALALVRHGTERTLVVVFSDGQDTMSILDPASVRKVVREANAVVYGVLTETPAVRIDSLWLSDVAHDTGGRTLVARSVDTLSRVFLQIAAEFRSRYVLVYTPTGVGRDDGWHDIDVSLLHRRGTLTTRRGYVAAP